MGRPPGWAAALTGRAVMLSPGRPPVRRDLERAFWVQIARGLTSEDAAVACGVSSPVGSRWFRHAGGMPPIELAPVSGRYLSFSEREDIAVLRAEGISMRQIAIRIGRSPSTISRERGAICTPCTASARQIGTTPNFSRCSSMNSQISGVAGRTPARRNLLRP